MLEAAKNGLIPPDQQTVASSAGPQACEYPFTFGAFAFGMPAAADSAVSDARRGQKLVISDWCSASAVLLLASGNARPTLTTSAMRQKAAAAAPL